VHIPDIDEFCVPAEFKHLPIIVTFVAEPDGTLIMLNLATLPDAIAS
jgi:hypothetical protein